MSTTHSFYPPTEAETRAIGSLLVIVDPSLIKLVMKGDEIAGFLIAYHDVSAGLQKARGRLFPTRLVPHPARPAKDGLGQRQRPGACCRNIAGWARTPCSTPSCATPFRPRLQKHIDIVQVNGRTSTAARTWRRWASNGTNATATTGWPWDSGRSGGRVTDRKAQPRRARAGKSQKWSARKSRLRRRHRPAWLPPSSVRPIRDEDACSAAPGGLKNRGLGRIFTVRARLFHASRAAESVTWGSLPDRQNPPASSTCPLGFMARRTVATCRRPRTPAHFRISEKRSGAGAPAARLVGHALGRRRAAARTRTRPARSSGRRFQARCLIASQRNVPVA